MVFIVYSLADAVSASAAEELKKQVSLEEVEPINGMRHFKYGKTDVLELPKHHLESDFLDDCIKTDCIIFLSRHSSTKGLPAFTVHPEGNWSGEAKIGGKPRQLSYAAPVQMLRVLQTMKKDNTTAVPVTYEATHHGPLLRTPSLYAEIGGNEEIWKDRTLASMLSRFVLSSLDAEAAYDKVALGIGGLHYADKFTKLALEGKFAFAHIMSKYYVSELDMLQQAATRSTPAPEVAVVEWKSLNSSEREKVINKLNEIGLDYVRA